VRVHADAAADADAAAITTATADDSDSDSDSDTDTDTCSDGEGGAVLLIGVSRDDASPGSFCARLDTATHGTVALGAYPTKRAAAAAVNAGAARLTELGVHVPPSIIAGVPPCWDAAQAARLSVDRWHAAAAESRCGSRK
jgi:hypothetical protein